MAIISDQNKKQVKELFDAQLQGPVEALLFYVDPDEQYTAATREILTELAALSGGRLTVRELSLEKDAEEAAAHKVEQIPAIILQGEGGAERQAHFYGAPLGYEFMVLLEDLVDLSRGETRLADPTRQQVQAIADDVTIQVFTTPT